MSGDPQPSVAGWGPQALDAQSIGHVALHGKLKLTRAGSGLGVAVATQVGVPVSDAPRNAGADPSLWYWPTMIFEKRFGSEEQLRIAVNVGYRGHSASTTTLALRDGRLRDGSRVTYGAGASLRVSDPLDVVVETYGTYLTSDSDAAVKPSNEALGGLKVFVDKSSHLLHRRGTSRSRAASRPPTCARCIGFVFEPPRLRQRRRRHPGRRGRLSQHARRSIERSGEERMPARHATTTASPTPRTHARS